MTDASYTTDDTPGTEPTSHLIPPPGLPPPLTTTAPELLNTHDLGIEAFEGLVHAVALRVDGANNARVFGNRGHTQDGLDVLAWFEDDTVWAYQAKRYQQYQPKRLKTAVRLYMKGNRAKPHKPSKFVMVVACLAESPKMIAALHELWQEFPDEAIELRDRRWLSESLRPLPDVVRTYFGEATAQVFCRPPTGQPAPQAPEPRPPTADAVMRGPIEALGLGDQYRAALGTADPAERARRLEPIAERLAEEHYAPHAAMVNRTRITLLTRAGDHQAAGVNALNALVHALEHHSTPSLNAARSASESIDTDAIEAPLAASVHAALALATFECEGGVDPIPMITRAATLTDENPHALAITVLAAEHAIAAARPDLIETLRPAANALLNSTTTPSSALSARLRACLADASGNEWATLAAAAPRRYPPSIAALLTARHARHLATNDRGPDAVPIWDTAIERACNVNSFPDAAGWCESQLRVLNEYRTPWSEVAQRGLADSAAVLRATDGPETVPEPPQTYERALADTHLGRWPSALQEAIRYRRWTIAAARLDEENIAHALLGRLLLAAGEPGLATTHMVRGAVADDTIREAADALPEAAFDPPAVTRSLPGRNATALSLLTRTADLIPDDKARDWTDAILDGRTGTVFGNAATSALLALVPAGAHDENRAQRVLDYLTPLIAGRHLYGANENSTVDTLVTIADRHENLSASAVELLLRLLTGDQTAAHRVLSTASHLLRRHPDLVRAACPSSTEPVSIEVRLVLASIGESLPTAELTRELLTSARRPPREPGHWSGHAGYTREILIVEHTTPQARKEFVERLLTTVEDVGDQPTNRALALGALAYMADRISTETPELHDRIWDLATRTADEPAPNLPEGSLDNLLGMMTFGTPADVRGAALRTAAATAGQDTQRQHTVYRMIVPALADPQCVLAAARALLRLPAAISRDYRDHLASYPDQWVRAAAAVLWAQDPHDEPTLGRQLAHDAEPAVRRSLATAVTTALDTTPTNEALTAVRDILATDVRRSVRMATLQPQ